MGDSDAAKIQKHLNLLKKEYVKLQNKTLDLEQKLSLTAKSELVDEDTFVAQLLRTANDLFEKEIFSDVSINYSGKSVRAHKFVLAARSDCWCEDLNSANSIDLDGCSVAVGNSLIKWIYTDISDIPNDESFIIDLVSIANRYKLRRLRMRCESQLISSVSVSNCIRFYQIAEEIGADSLKKYCSEIISNHWDDLETKDFEGINAHLLYEMFKAKSAHPVHFAIRHHREDIVFLYLIEFNLQLPGKLNEIEPETGFTPLQIALLERQESIATTLVQHNCDVNSLDSSGKTLLHKAIEIGDEYAATFLIENGADIKAATHSENLTASHLVAMKKFPTEEANVSMSNIAHMLLLHDININFTDNGGKTALHHSIISGNTEVFKVLLEDSRIDLEIKDFDGHSALWYALLANIEEDEAGLNFSSLLISKGSSADAIDIASGDSLLHKAANVKMTAAGLFLIEHGAQVNHTNKKGESPLHVAAKNGLVALVNKLLTSGSNPNVQTLETEVLKTQSAARRIEFEKSSVENRQRIINLEKSKALKAVKELPQNFEINKSFEKDEASNNPFFEEDGKQDDIGGANPFADDTADDLNPFNDDSNPFNGDSNPFNDDSLIYDEMQTATSVALALSGANHFTLNEGPKKKMDNMTLYNGKIDIAAIKSVEQIENFDFENMKISILDIEDGLHQKIVTECWNQTPLHMAIIENHSDVVNCFIQQADDASRGAIGGRIPMATDFNLVDSEGQSPLWLALATSQNNIASQLIEAGADVNGQNQTTNETLLHKSIMFKDIDISLFLIENGADVNVLNKEKMSPMEMAIHLQLHSVVEILCKHGANANHTDDFGNTLLFRALKSKQIEMALTLVNNGADTTGWHVGVNGCLWTLLHHAIFDKDDESACFLIKHGSDINSPRKPDFDHQGGSEVFDGLTPLHLACESEMDKVVQCLIEYDADINAQDSEGRTPIHIAIKTKNPIISKILLSHPFVNFKLKDNLGQTPFVVAMSCRDNDSSSLILAREPTSAEQFDNKGRNYLHTAIMNSDVDSVLFLVGIEVNVNSRIQDGTHRTPLHLAVPTGNEIIVRHLILAGADVNATDKNRQNPLHVAALEDKSSILEVLLQNGADPDLVDSNFNNALHLACQYGNLAAVKLLLTESHVNAEQYNAKGQNPLHVLSVYSRENAAAIFEVFRQTMPNYPVDALDAEENTAIYLAYVNGAVGLCCSLLKSGARMGTINKHNVSIFNAPVATKKLLFKLLDMLNSEPAWSEGQNCHACGTKFNVATRKHHCRHCGRLLCSKCSQQQMPILKYDLPKPVRVCQICFEFLTQDT